jgi:hypothetical protein
VRAAQAVVVGLCGYGRNRCSNPSADVALREQEGHDLFRAIILYSYRSSHTSNITYPKHDSKYKDLTPMGNFLQYPIGLLRGHEPLRQQLLNGGLI